MADLDAIVFIGGEVRKVEKKRDFVDRASGEVRPGKGRTCEVLTLAGFVKLSLPEQHDTVDIEEGAVIFVKAKVRPWTVKRDDGRELHGTAFVYDGDPTAPELLALGLATTLVTK
jgi:hypothetical protein